MKSNIQHISFRKKSIPIPADYRPLYKIGHLILILGIACRGNKASIMKLHFLSWAVKSRQNIVVVLSWIKDAFRSDFHTWGISPTVNRALEYAIWDGFIDNLGGNIKLTERGLLLFKRIKSDKELFSIEKEFLNKIGKNGISEEKIKELSAKFF